MGEHLWTINELCEYLHVDRSWVYQRSRFDEIPGQVRISDRHLRFDPAAVKAWVESRMATKGDEEID